MTPRDFCYWLQGFFELNNPTSLNEEQTLLIKKHLYNAFQHDCESITEENLKNFGKIIPLTSEQKNITNKGSCLVSWNQNSYVTTPYLPSSLKRDGNSFDLSWMEDYPTAVSC